MLLAAAAVVVSAIVQVMEPLEGVLGMLMRITCRTYSTKYTFRDVDLLHNGSRIGPSRVTSNTLNSTHKEYVINSLTRADAGEYTCYLIGNNFSPIIQLKSKPLKTSSISCMRIVLQFWRTH